MRGPAEPRSRGRGLLGPALMALSMLIVLVGLGLWQLDRKAWKDDLVQTLTRRLAVPSSDLPDAETWPRLDRTTQEFRHVAFTAEFLHDREALVYTTGSQFRARATGPGYWVFTPARLTDGSLVVVNRGFVSEGRQEPGSRLPGQVAGTVDIVGVMRWPEERGLFTPADNPARNLWFVRDQHAIAAAKNLGPVAPFFVEQESPAPPGGFPRVGRIQPSLTNNHLQYAMTWFGLAAVIIVVFALWSRSRRREIP
jgi:surfeit locus 1 family protein